MDIHLALDNSSVVAYAQRMIRGEKVRPRYGFALWRDMEPFLVNRVHTVQWVPSHGKKGGWTPSHTFTARALRRANEHADVAATTGVEQAERQTQYYAWQREVDDLHKLSENAIWRLYRHMLRHAVDHDCFATFIENPLA